MPSGCTSCGGTGCSCFRIAYTRMWRPDDLGGWRQLPAPGPSWPQHLGPPRPLRLEPACPLLLEPACPLRLEPACPLRLEPACPLRLKPACPLHTGPATPLHCRLLPRLRRLHCRLLPRLLHRLLRRRRRQERRLRPRARAKLCRTSVGTESGSVAMTRRVERQIALITELRFDNTRQRRLAAPAPPREHVAGRARRFQRHGTC